MLIHELEKRKLITIPKWLADNTHLLVRIGGKMYGYSDENGDNDCYGICIPPKEIIFPKGYIRGFGPAPKNWEICENHGIHVADWNNEEYDVTILSIIKFFDLCMQCNPNYMTCLYVPENHVLHCTQIGNFIRDNRKSFLHKGLYAKYVGYATSQLHKMKIKNPNETSKRRELVDRYKYDVKFGLHLIRLLLEAEQLLQEGNLDVMRHKELLKAIRRGEWKEEQVYEFAEEKKKYLESVYQKSTLPAGPDIEKIKGLLMTCLEMHYGNLSDCIVMENREQVAISEIKKVLERYNL